MKRTFTKYPSKIIASTEDSGWIEELARLIAEYWRSSPKDAYGPEDMEDLRRFLLDRTRVGEDDLTPWDIDKAWDKAAIFYYDTSEDNIDDSVILSDGEEITNRAEAYAWLKSNCDEYGNTYFWNSTLKNDLNRLIEKFGNTYFWAN